MANNFIENVTQGLNGMGAFLGFNKVSSATILESLIASNEIKRVENIKTFRDYYNGYSIPYQTAEGELPYLNVSFALIEKSITWLVGNSPVIKGRKDIHSLTSELVDELLGNSGDAHFYRSSILEGSITGDCILKIDYDQNLNFGDGGYYLRVLDSSRTFVEYKNFRQGRNLNRVLMSWDELDDDGNISTYIELWDNETVKVYFGTEVKSTVITPDSPFQFELLTEEDFDDSGNSYAEYRHPFGELPFVHIPNILLSDNDYGRSDLHDIFILNREINEQLLSYKDNVDYHSNPVTVVYGASMKNVEKGADKIWSNLPTDAKVENLEVTQSFEMITKLIELLEKGVGLSGIPMHLLNSTTPTTSDTSAAAMRLAFLPLLEFTNRKSVSYSAGYKKAIEMSLRFMNATYDLGLESLDALDPKTAEKFAEFQDILGTEKIANFAKLRMVPFYKIDIKFVDYLPRNRSLDLADITLEIQNKLEDTEGALERLGVEDIEEKIENIIEDAQFRGEYDAIVAGAMTPDQATIESDNEESQNGESQSTKNSPAIIENSTGQSSDRTSAQRAMKGRGAL